MICLPITRWQCSIYKPCDTHLALAFVTGKHIHFIQMSLQTYMSIYHQVATQTTEDWKRKCSHQSPIVRWVFLQPGCKFTFYIRTERTTWTSLRRNHCPAKLKLLGRTWPGYTLGNLERTTRNSTRIPSRTMNNEFAVWQFLMQMICNKGLILTGGLFYQAWLQTLQPITMANENVKFTHGMTNAQKSD